MNCTPTVLGYLPFLDVLDLGGSFSRLSRKYGDVFSLKVGTETAVVLSSYDAIKSVLTDARFDSRPNTLMFKVRPIKEFFKSCKFRHRRTRSTQPITTVFSDKALTTPGQKVILSS